MWWVVEPENYEIVIIGQLWWRMKNKKIDKHQTNMLPDLKNNNVIKISRIFQEFSQIEYFII